MTDNNHPITPPPELIAKWAGSMCGHYEAARLGADEELKACCEWLLDHGYDLCSPEMRKDRRPKPPSLKERALAVLDDASNRIDAAHENIIRRALESLPD